MGENATEISERLSRIEQGVARIDERTETADGFRQGADKN